MVKKSKYDRRRAVDCKLLEKSKTHKGYCKYVVTICELDGTCHKQPCYGKDMQGALSRLMNTERTVKVERKLENNVGWIFIMWLFTMGWPVIFADHSTPAFLLYSFGSILVLFGAAAWWYNYIKRGE
jgi:hypothetical protein